MRFLPRQEVETLPGGVYKWRKYRTDVLLAERFERGGPPPKAPENVEEGFQLLDEEWRADQARRLQARAGLFLYKEQIRSLEPDDSRERQGVKYELKAQRYTEVFQGRLWADVRKFEFLEDGTRVRVAVEVPAQLVTTGRACTTWRDCQLYHALRGAHAKAKAKSREAARQQATLAAVPETCGEMAVKQKTPSGKLVYSWKGVEIDVTPRLLRQGVVEEGTSTWKRARVAEMTPERALRKMREQTKRLALKAAKG